MDIDDVALVLVGALVMTMPLFALASRGRPDDAEVARRPASVLLGRWVRNWLMWVIAPAERAFVRARVTPDVFNYLGAGFGVLAGFFFGRGLLPIAGWMVLLGGAMDIFDGRVARAQGIASPRGAFLDSTLDRFAETFTFIGLAWHFSGRPWASFAVALALGGSMLVSYARARGEGLGVQFKGGVMQRAERLVLLAVASLVDNRVAGWAGWPPGTLLAIAIGVMGVGSLGTAIYRTWWIAGELGKRRS